MLAARRSRPSMLAGGRSTRRERGPRRDGAARRRRVAARARLRMFVDAVAQVGVLAARDRLVLAQLHLQVDRLVARVVELRLELRRERRVAARAAA